MQRSVIAGGGPQNVITTTKTLSTYLDGFSTKGLPQTVRDAVTVARRLGFRYLWIDALCIIQDDPQDKTHEISQMANIYNFATVTIAAARASKISDGFLGPWTKSPDGCRVPFQCPHGTLGEVEILAPPPPTDETLEPLNQRAWTFQERLLSPRSIFGQREVMWLCQSSNGPCALLKSIYYFSALTTSIPAEIFQT